MDGAVIAHRIQFAVLIMFHYLFPVLTMGLSVMIAVMKTIYYRTKDEKYAEAVRFWVKVFVLNFGAGVATGVPMEFQFGTNWARFSMIGGSVIGTGLMMEGVYAFFLESFFLGVLLLGEKKVSPFVHWLSAVILAFGTCLSGFFITATDSFMQHPVAGAYRVLPDGRLALANLWIYLTNPYELWMFIHTIMGSMVTAAMVVCAVGAYYLITQKNVEFGKMFIRHGVITGLIFSLLLAATGSKNGEQVSVFNPTKLAAMEGTFKTQPGAPLALYGIPDTKNGRLIDGVEIPKLLSILAYGSPNSTVKGLNDVPKADRPPIEVTYYAYHIMITIGVLLVLLFLLGGLLIFLKQLDKAKWYQILMIAMFPISYIGNEAGWCVAEVGRQPWLVYGLLRTTEGTSTNVTQGATIFSLLGFLGIYGLLFALFLIMVIRLIVKGPGSGSPQLAKEESK
jgi:cytochrome d ubiquinol oxidase subunit I